MLRILVVLPMYGGSLPIGRYCVSALLELGHSVRVFNAPELFPGYQGLKKLDLSPDKLPTLETAFLRLVSQAIWLQAEEQNPQLILALAQAPLDKYALLRMRNAGIKTVMWFVEDYRLFTYWKIVAPLYDAFAVIQKQPFLKELKEIGQKNAFYLPLACQPDFHKPLALDDSDQLEYGADISFLGAGYPNRKQAFQKLADKNFKIWGTDWQNTPCLQDKIQKNGIRIEADEAVKIYNAAKINLNLHSSIYADAVPGQGDFVNPRTFELAAIGAFQLVDKRTLMPELFTDDELATFCNNEEMLSLIDYYLKHPQEREAKAKAARKRALNDHTYAQRMQTLISFMQKHCGLHQTNNSTEKPIYAELTHKLGLKMDAAPADIVAALKRQKSLSPQEAALLFKMEQDGKS